MHKSAIIIDSYRYELRRYWDGSLPVACFIMLNPSTADGMQDDATIRKCIGFAKRWGYGGIIVVNLFAHRSTDWRGIKRALDPIGPSNQLYVADAIRDAMTVICAWGRHGELYGQGLKMKAWLQARKIPYVTLGRCTNGEPPHPLMLGYNTEIHATTPD